MPNASGLSRSTTPLLVAANVACSWLTAVGIANRQVGESQFLVDGRLLVTLYDSSVEKRPDVGSGQLALDARELASTNTSISVPAWHRITETIGKGQPNPICRPAAKGRQQDILMRSLRLAEFHQAPALPKPAEEKYQDVIRSTTGAFYSRNRQAMDAAGLERADLHCAGLVWAANFHHRYRRETEELKTVKFLGRYIQQRCAQLARYGAFNRTSPVIYTDTLDTYDHAEVEGPSTDDVTNELMDKLSYMPAEELRQRIADATRRHPNLATAGKRLAKRMGVK